jgi:hypothetical protein
MRDADDARYVADLMAAFIEQQDAFAIGHRQWTARAVHSAEFIFCWKRYQSGFINISYLITCA